MEFTCDELARLITVLENDLNEQKRIREKHVYPVDFFTPTFTLYSNLLKAYYEGDKILHIGIKD